MKQHSIPPDLVMKADQTPSAYVPVGRKTMATKGSQSVPIFGSHVSDKCNITLTLVITFQESFCPSKLWRQVNFVGLPKFPKGLSISQNEKHWSNEQETVRLIADIVNPYVVNKRKELNLPINQKALMIWDIFKVQMTEVVKNKLSSSHIDLVAAPPNMTHLFQPLDLTVNGVAKKFLQKFLTTYYSSSCNSNLKLESHLKK